MADGVRFEIGVIIAVFTAFVLVLVAAAFVVNRQTHKSQPESDTHRRLAAEKAQLEMLEAERVRLGDPAYDKETEEQIIWNELVELELQDIDEQVARIRNSADKEA